MTVHTVDHRLVELALARVDTASFEKFVHAFAGTTDTYRTVPLGGMHDGGADGFVEPPSEHVGKPTHFIQTSKTDRIESKIRQTVKRLRDFGRTVERLTYYSSQSIPKIDQLEESLGDELDITLKARDASFIVSRINSSPESVQAFNSYLYPCLSFLKELGGATSICVTDRLPVRNLCVFLSQELERRSDRSPMLDSVVDSLILWSLEGTDPSCGIFLSVEAIQQRIEEALPAAKHYIRGSLRHRLGKLSSKGGVQGREINWHAKQKGYCLPFTTRQLVESENIEDEILKHSVSEEFRLRIATILPAESSVGLTDTIIECCHTALERTFERQGMEIARFVEGESVGDEFRSTIADILRQTVEDMVSKGNEAELVHEAAFNVLRGTFYGSSVVERRYLAKLSRTYILLFLLKNDPQTVEYFTKMSSKLTLYVGADIIIRALSEYYLPSEDQMTANMLKVISAAGSTLVLTQKTLDEVWTSLRATAFEFEREYRSIQHHIDLTIARNFPKILTRSYFYARLDPDRPDDFKPESFIKFLGNFLDYNELMSNSRQDSLQAYLILKLGLKFERLEETLRGIDEKEVEALCTKILEKRRGGLDRAEDRNRLLAYNDALHVHRIYRRRREDNDDSPANRFGFSTWWLTQETAVRKATRDIVKSHGGRMYMLRPEFVLNFISYSPRLSEVRHSFGEIFPSLLGVRLSSRLKDEVFRKVVSEAKEIAKLDDARAGGMLGQLANDLKTDLQKHYDHSYKDTREEA